MKQDFESGVFKALADPTRRAVLEKLMRGEESVSALTEMFEVSQPAISQHLAALRKSGLVTERRVGRNAFYRARPVGLAPVVEWMDRYQVFWQQRLMKLKSVLKEMDDE